MDFSLSGQPSVRMSYNGVLAAKKGSMRVGQNSASVNTDAFNIGSNSLCNARCLRVQTDPMNDRQSPELICRRRHDTISSFGSRVYVGIWEGSRHVARGESTVAKNYSGIVHAEQQERGASAARRLSVFP
jgi:hypothetical protein